MKYIQNINKSCLHVMNAYSHLTRPSSGHPLMHNAPVSLSVRVLPTEMMQWDNVCGIEKLEQVSN
jgi:hypothetical protein